MSFRTRRRLAHVVLTAGLIAGGAPITMAQDSASHAPRRVRVIATADLHGTLAPYVDSRGFRSGGLSAMAAVIDNARRECAAPECVAVVVDAGDLFQGELASELSYGRDVVEAYNQIGYDASAIGNRDFDWGTDTLRARARQAHFRFLAANVRTTSGRRIAGIDGEMLVRRGGLAIGIVGVSTQLTPQTTVPASVEGLAFGDPAAAIDSSTRRLRALGADVVIVLGHAGARCEGNLFGVATGKDSDRCAGESIGTLRRLTQHVDAYLGGHTHQKLNMVVAGTPLVSPSANGRNVAVLDIPLDAARHSSSGAVMQLRPATDTTSLPRLAAVDSIVAHAVTDATVVMAAPVTTVKRTLERHGDQFALGNLVADAQRWATTSDVAVVNSHGVHADLRAGPATYGALFDVQPFGNLLYRYHIKGAVLRQYFEHVVDADSALRHVSGAIVTFDPTRPVGQRLLALTLANGRPVADSATYTLAMNDYMRLRDEELALGQDALGFEPTNFTDREAFFAYVRSRPRPLTAPDESRIRAVSPASDKQVGTRSGQDTPAKRR
jgi:5'-nucleotidase